MGNAEPAPACARAQARDAVLPWMVLLVLAVISSAVAAGSLVLVGVDLAIGRQPPAMCLSLG